MKCVIFNAVNRKTNAQLNLNVYVGIAEATVTNLATANYGATVTLERKKRCKALTDALDDMVEHMVGMDEDDMEFSTDDMIEALRQPELIREMPDEVLLQILNVTPDGVFPDDIMKSLEKEAKRRGFFKG